MNWLHRLCELESKIIIIITMIIVMRAIIIVIVIMIVIVMKEKRYNYPACRQRYRNCWRKKRTVRWWLRTSSLDARNVGKQPSRNRRTSQPSARSSSPRSCRRCWGDPNDKSSRSAWCSSSPIRREDCGRISRRLH